jgi:hypothetical protein
MPDAMYFDVRDYNGEISRTNFPSLVLTEANFTAQGGALTSLVSAVDAITLGTMAGSGMQKIENLGLVPPVNELAQIETGWKIIYTDSQQFLDPGTDLVPNPGYGKAFQLDWPCADYEDNLLTNSDLANLEDAGVVAAFVAAFEAVVLSPYGGTITITSISVTGIDR